MTLQIASSDSLYPFLHPHVAIDIQGKLVGVRVRLHDDEGNLDVTIQLPEAGSILIVQLADKLIATLARGEPSHFAFLDKLELEGKLRRFYGGVMSDNFVNKNVYHLRERFEAAMSTCAGRIPADYRTILETTSIGIRLSSPRVTLSLSDRDRAPANFFEGVGW
jgi:hypothetical protein